jgi:protein phosphatase
MPPGPPLNSRGTLFASLTLITSRWFGQKKPDERGWFVSQGKVLALKEERIMSQIQCEPEHTSAETLTLSQQSSPFAARSFGLSDRGRVRARNEDHFAIVELAKSMIVHHTSMLQPKAQYSSHRGHVFIIADGMGGHQGGEVASALTVLTVEELLLNKLNCCDSDTAHASVLSELQSALIQADARIFEEAANHPELTDMGTTLTMGFAINWKLFVAHVGDSRCYLFSQDELRQMTQDHTVVNDLVRQGLLSRQAASRHQLRHAVTNVLGGPEPGIQVELHELNLEPDDVLLLCSDGLTEMIPDERIAAILRDEQEPSKACERLVNEANEKGGKDNITTVVSRFEGI